MSLSAKSLGIGVGLRPIHYDYFLKEVPKPISWVEVVSENYMKWKTHPAGDSLDTLKKVRENLPVVLHGVGMNLGSTDPLNKEYFQKLRELIEIIEPEWVSDHLCWTGVDQVQYHDLLPIPYNSETLQWFCDRVHQAQDLLKQPILIENPSSYLEFESSDIPEWEFITELHKRTQCRLLLDVNNIFVSGKNHAFDPDIYLEHLPADAIQQIHLAGHTYRGSLRIDTHGAPVCDEVWDLYRKTVAKFGTISTMIERDTNIPEWDELKQEVIQISNIWEEISVPLQSARNPAQTRPIHSVGKTRSF